MTESKTSSHFLLLSATPHNGYKDSDQNNSARYLDIWRTVKSLAEGAKIPLGELDRVFWNFGRSICQSQNPKCEYCPISKICCFHRYKQI